MARKPITIPATTKDPVLKAVRELLELYDAAKPSRKKKPPLGEEVDRLYLLREAKKAGGRVEKATKAAYQALEDKLIDDQKKEDLQGARGGTTQMSIGEAVYPVGEDWDAVWRYAKRNNRPDLFQRRLNQQAVKDLWEDGKKVPGVGKFTKLTVSLTKVGSK